MGCLPLGICRFGVVISDLGMFSYTPLIFCIVILGMLSGWVLGILMVVGM